jgi:preprotein translocase SecE subunit
MLKKVADNLKAFAKGILNLPKRFIGLVGKSFAFLRESFAELGNVTWLSRRDTLKFSTYIVLFIVLGSVVIALLDLGIFELFKLITN